MGERKRSTATGRCSDHPIIEAAQRGLARPLTCLGLSRKLSPQQVRVIVQYLFGDEAIREIGRLVIEALLKGDKRFTSVVKRAIKEADHLFNRDREPVLLRQAMDFIYDGGWRSQDYAEGTDVVKALKKEIEKRFNNGQPLQQHRWNRIRKALRLPTLMAGRPFNSGTKR